MTSEDRMKKLQKSTDRLILCGASESEVLSSYRAECVAMARAEKCRSVRERRLAWELIPRSIRRAGVLPGDDRGMTEE
jgi:hypothetical protein